MLPKYLLPLLPLLSLATAQGRENLGLGVLPPNLTGVRPGFSPDQATYWSPNPACYVDPNLFEQEMIDLHNRYRSEHGVYPVSWDPKLVETAQQLVDTCVYGHSAAMQDNATPYGENIYFGYETVTAGVLAWGEERNEYEQAGYNLQSPAHNLLHFTQMVWKPTNTIGCARKKCIADQNGGGQVQELWYVACHYYTRGNVWGQYEANVFPRGTPVGSR